MRTNKVALKIQNEIDLIISQNMRLFPFSSNIRGLSRRIRLQSVLRAYLDYSGRYDPRSIGLVSLHDHDGELIATWKTQYHLSLHAAFLSHFWFSIGGETTAKHITANGIYSCQHKYKKYSSKELEAFMKPA